MNTSNINVVYTIDVCNNRYMAGMLDGIYISLLLGLFGLILYIITNLNNSEKIVVNVYTCESEVYEDDEDDEYEYDDDEYEYDEDEDDEEEQDDEEEEEEETPKKPLKVRREEKPKEPVELQEMQQNETTQEKGNSEPAPTVTEDALD